MSAPSIDINGRQASDRGILLQRAADANHAFANRCERWREGGSLLVAVVGFVAVGISALRPWAGALGATWAVVAFAVLGPASKRATVRAATVQDQFDSWLYGLDRGDHVTAWLNDSDLIRSAKKSRRDVERFKTWYPNVAGLPDSLAVLSCQRANLDWDTTLRRRYADRLAIFAISVPICGVLIGLALDLSVRALTFGFLVPSAPAVMLAAQGARAQSDIAADKHSLLTDVVSTIEHAIDAPDEAVELLGRARRFQDSLFDQRCRTERVLGRVYEQHRDEDEDVMQATVDELRRRLSSG